MFLILTGYGDAIKGCCDIIVASLVLHCCESNSQALSAFYLSTAFLSLSSVIKFVVSNFSLTFYNINKTANRFDRL